MKSKVIFFTLWAALVAILWAAPLDTRIQHRNAADTGWTYSLLADPNADRFLGWDDSEGEYVWLAGSGGVDWNNIGDAGADGTIALGAFETDWTSTLDSAGKAIWTITNTDADTAADTSFFDLNHYDGADANVFYMRMIGDSDGTPVTNYSFSQTAFNISAGVTSTFLGPVLMNGPAIRDENGLGVLETESAASAVNYFKMRNSATGDPVELIAGGTDTDIDIALTPKGAGRVLADAVNVSGAVEAASLEIGGVAVTATGTELNYVDGVTSAIQTQLDTKAPLASPSFTGTSIFGNGATSAGLFRINEDSDDGSNYASFTVPALAANTAYTLPADDGDADQVLSTNGSGTLDWVTPSGGASFAPTTSTQFFDDFLHETPFAYPWVSNNAGSGTPSVYAQFTGNRPGVWRFKSGTGTTDRASIYLGRDQSYFSGGAVEFETAAYVENLSDGTEEYDFWIGSGDTRDNSSQVDGVMFVYDRNTSTNWQLVTSKASTRTTRDTGVAVTAGQWVKLAFTVNAGATSVQAYVDGSTAGAAITSNIPDTSSNTFAPVMVSIMKSAGTTERNVRVDYVWFKQTFTTPR